MRRDKIVCGRRASCRPVTFGDGKRYTGRICYVDGKEMAGGTGRWLTVEFDLPGGKIRESFMREDVELI